MGAPMGLVCGAGVCSAASFEGAVAESSGVGLAVGLAVGTGLGATVGDGAGGGSSTGAACAGQHAGVGSGSGVSSGSVSGSAVGAAPSAVGADAGSRACIEVDVPWADAVAAGGRAAAMDTAGEHAVRVVQEIATAVTAGRADVAAVVVADAAAVATVWASRASP
ncbi:hypothetical protein G3I70_08070, partial [Actinomadura bangladeshensis]|nr:hypothetical protein [Actinomadura bangladeshensis]